MQHNQQFSQTYDSAKFDTADNRRRYRRPPTAPSTITTTEKKDDKIWGLSRTQKGSIRMTRPKPPAQTKTKQKLSNKDIYTLSIFAPKHKKVAGFNAPHLQTGFDTDFTHHSNISFDEFMRLREVSAFRNTSLKATSINVRTNVTREQEDEMKKIEKQRFRKSSVKLHPTQLQLSARQRQQEDDPLLNVFMHPSMLTDKEYDPTGFLPPVQRETPEETTMRLNHIYQNSNLLGLEKKVQKNASSNSSIAKKKKKKKKLTTMRPKTGKKPSIKRQVKKSKEPDFDEAFDRLLEEATRNDVEKDPSQRQLESELAAIYLEATTSNSNVESNKRQILKTTSDNKNDKNDNDHNDSEYNDDALQDWLLQVRKRTQTVSSGKSINDNNDIDMNDKKNNNKEREESSNNNTNNNTNNSNSSTTNSAEQAKSLLAKYYASKFTSKDKKDESNRCEICHKTIESTDHVHAMTIHSIISLDTNYLFEDTSNITLKHVIHMLHTLSMSIADIISSINGFINVHRLFDNIEQFGQELHSILKQKEENRVFTDPRVKREVTNLIEERKNEIFLENTKIEESVMNKYIDNISIMCKGHIPELYSFIDICIEKKDRFSSFSQFISHLEIFTKPNTSITSLSADEYENIITALSTSEIFTRASTEIHEDDIKMLVFACNRNERLMPSHRIINKDKEKSSFYYQFQAMCDVGRTFSSVKELIGALELVPRINTYVSPSVCSKLMQFFRSSQVQKYIIRPEGAEQILDVSGIDISNIVLAILRYQGNKKSLMKSLYRWFHDFEKHVAQKLAAKQEKMVLYGGHSGVQHDISSEEKKVSVIEAFNASSSVISELPLEFENEHSMSESIVATFVQAKETAILNKLKILKREQGKQERYANSWEKRKEEGRKKYQAKLLAEKQRQEELERRELQIKEQRRQNTLEGIRYRKEMEAAKAKAIQERIQKRKEEKEIKRKEYEEEMKRADIARYKFVRKMLDQHKERNSKE